MLCENWSDRHIWLKKNNSAEDFKRQQKNKKRGLNSNDIFRKNIEEKKREKKSAKKNEMKNGGKKN